MELHDDGKLLSLVPAVDMPELCAALERRDARFAAVTALQLRCWAKPASVLQPLGDLAPSFCDQQLRSFAILPPIYCMVRR